MGGSSPDPVEPDPHSSFKLEVTVAIGYHRKRSLLAGKWEGPVTSFALLGGGGVIVALIVLKVIGLI